MISFILNTKVLVLGLMVRPYKRATSRQLSKRLQRMAEVSPAAFLVNLTFSVILLVVRDKNIIKTCAFYL